MRKLWILILSIFLIGCSQVIRNRKKQINVPQIESFNFSDDRVNLIGKPIDSYNDTIFYELTLVNRELKESQLSFYGKCKYQSGKGKILLEKTDSIWFYFAKKEKLSDRFITKFNIDTNQIGTLIKRDQAKSLFNYIAEDADYYIYLRLLPLKGILYTSKDQPISDLAYFRFQNGRKGNIYFQKNPKVLFIEKSQD